MPNACAALRTELPTTTQLEHVVGYGRPELERALHAGEDRVTLIAEGAIGVNETHFYEIPIPDDFFRPPKKRQRRVTVSLAHTPDVRRTRIDYNAAALTFRFVRAPTPQAVVAAYQRQPTRAEREAGATVVASVPDSDTKPGPKLRDAGAVQAASWVLKQSSIRHDGQRWFLAITHQGRPWARDPEPVAYALVVTVEDESESAGRVRMYTQIRAQLRLRAA